MRPFRFAIKFLESSIITRLSIEESKVIRFFIAPFLVRRVYGRGNILNERRWPDYCDKLYKKVFDLNSWDFIEKPLQNYNFGKGGLFQMLFKLSMFPISYFSLGVVKWTVFPLISL